MINKGAIMDKKPKGAVKMRSIPTDIYIESGAVKAHGSEIAALGKKAMIVTGKHSSAVNGSLDDVRAVLESQGIEYVIYNDIEENPSVETVYIAATAAVKKGVDLFVAVGGGSPMDASKAISMLAKNGIVCENAEFSENAGVIKAEKCDVSDSIGRVEELLYTPAPLPFYPIVCVPTTCGTGSEATPYSILTSHIKQTKKSIAHKIFPSLALVDYHYLKTSSYSGMKSTCVDALAHMIESRLNTNANTFSRAYAEEGMRLWASCKGCLETEDSFANMTDEQFSTFMQASVLAGMAISYTGTSIPHGLSYTLTYENGVPHGKAVGVFLSGFLKNYGDSSLAGYVVKELLGFKDIDAFRDYIRRLFGKLEISDKLWQKDRDGILANPAKLKNYPFELTAEVLDDYVGYYNG